MSSREDPVWVVARGIAWVIDITIFNIVQCRREKSRAQRGAVLAVRRVHVCQDCRCTVHVGLQGRICWKSGRGKRANH